MNCLCNFVWLLFFGEFMSKGGSFLLFFESLFIVLYELDGFVGLICLLVFDGCLSLV